MRRSRPANRSGRTFASARSNRVSRATHKGSGDQEVDFRWNEHERRHYAATDLPWGYWIPRGTMESDNRPDLGAQSMQSQERDAIAAFLEGAVSAGASSKEVAALVASAFRGIDQALSPIVGQRGMAALYKRSLHLCRPVHPWLPPPPANDADSEMEIAALIDALATQTSVDAAAAGTRLLGSFRVLLNTLIGEPLTERLLRPVWANFLSGPSARDTKS